MMKLGQEDADILYYTATVSEKTNKTYSSILAQNMQFTHLQQSMSMSTFNDPLDP